MLKPIHRRLRCLTHVPSILVPCFLTSSSTARTCRSVNQLQCSAGHSVHLQAMQLLKLGIFGFLFDFWTWFFDGNCATYLQALPNFTYSINAMPNLGYRRVTPTQS